MYCCIVLCVLHLDGSVLLYCSVCSESGWECTDVLYCMYCIWMGVYCCFIVYVLYLDGSVLLYCIVCTASGWECTAVI